MPAPPVKATRVRWSVEASACRPASTSGGEGSQSAGNSRGGGITGGGGGFGTGDAARYAAYLTAGCALIAAARDLTAAIAALAVND